MDLHAILKTSRLFYRDHGLDSWRQALPKKLVVADEEGVVAEMTKNGFTEGFAFPRFALQMQEMENLIEQTARKPAVGLAENQQYAGSVVLADNWNKEANGQICQRTEELAGREDGAYLFLFSPRPLTNAWGRTAKQIGELFAAKGWQGFTVPEYFVLQRYFCETRRDHRFYDQEDMTHPGHWLWLLDSMTETDCSVAMGNSRGINVQACPVGNRDARRAALAGMVVPLAA